MILVVINMKETLKKSMSALMIIFIIYCIVFIIFNAGIVGEYISSAVERCILIIIPSMFAMMVLSGIFINSGITDMMSRFFSPVLIIFVLSMIAGYPVGAKMLSSEFEKGSISKKQAELYMSVCFGAGPAFIFGCISGILFPESNAGIIIFLSSVSANIITALIIIIFSKEKKNKSLRKGFIINAEILVNSVLSGGKNILNICLMIISFSVFLCIMKYSGVIVFLSGVLSYITDIDISVCEGMIESILEVTNLSGLEKNNYTLLPFISSAVSFGGICVILQIRTVIKKSLSMKPFIFTRLACAVLSGIICRIIMPFMLQNQTLSTSDIDYRIYSEMSPVPSYMLLVMIIMLLWNFRNKKGHQK